MLKVAAHTALQAGLLGLARGGRRLGHCSDSCRRVGMAPTVAASGGEWRNDAGGGARTRWGEGNFLRCRMSEEMVML
jgi:hypothetical protein